MADSIETSEREAEEPRDQSRPQNWDHETATRVFVGGELLPIREMAAEPAPPPVAANYEPHPVGTGERIKHLERVNAELVEEHQRLNAIVNTPQADDFLRAVSTEAEHQRQRWGSVHDAGKAPADWFWLIGYLAGKALHAHAAGNAEKAEHHVITTAAACANWHAALTGRHTAMRPGIDGEAALTSATKEQP